jgi:hypothetical protein
MSFAVLSLPRSRTAWLAAFFNASGLRCEHELIARSDSFEHAIEKMNQGIGSVDTGQVFRINDIKRQVKDIRIIVIERDKEEVNKSLFNCGFANTDWLIKQQAIYLEKEKQFYPSFRYEDIDNRIEEIWGIVSGGRDFPKEQYDTYKNYKIELSDIASYAQLNKVNKIIKNYAIQR